MKLQGYRQAAGGGKTERRGETRTDDTDHRDTRQTPSGAKAGRDKKERERNRVGETGTDRGDD